MLVESLGIISNIHSIILLYYYTAERAAQAKRVSRVNRGGCKNCDDGGEGCWWGPWCALLWGIRLLYGGSHAYVGRSIYAQKCQHGITYTI